MPCIFLHLRQPTAGLSPRRHHNPHRLLINHEGHHRGCNMGTLPIMVQTHQTSTTNYSCGIPFTSQAQLKSDVQLEKSCRNMWKQKHVLTNQNHSPIGGASVIFRCYVSFPGYTWYEEINIWGTKTTTHPPELPTKSPRRETWLVQVGDGGCVPKWSKHTVPMLSNVLSVCPCLSMTCVPTKTWCLSY